MHIVITEGIDFWKERSGWEEEWKEQGRSSSSYGLRLVGEEDEPIIESPQSNRADDIH